MYITVMDFSNKTISQLSWDVEDASTEDVEVILERAGFRISQIAYMTSDEEIPVGIIELSDLIESDFSQNK